LTLVAGGRTKSKSEKKKTRRRKEGKRRFPFSGFFGFQEKNVEILTGSEMFSARKTVSQTGKIKSTSKGETFRVRDGPFQWGKKGGKLL